MERNGITEQAS